MNTLEDQKEEEESSCDSLMKVKVEKIVSEIDIGNYTIQQKWNTAKDLTRKSSSIPIFNIVKYKIDMM